MEGENTEGPSDWLFTARCRSLTDGTVIQSGKIPATHRRGSPDRLLTEDGMAGGTWKHGDLTHQARGAAWGR